MSGAEDDYKAGDFLPLTILVEACLSQDKQTFLEARPNALLLVDNAGEDVENATFQTIAAASSGSKDKAEPKDKVLARLGTMRFVRVLRKPENKFAAMLTLGRAANSDIRINVPSVSKFHAYFTHVARDGCWYLADANSSNGTFIDGKELPPSHGKLGLKDGSVLRFGPDVSAHFYTAAGFWERVHAQEDPDEDEGDDKTIKVRADELLSGGAEG